MATFQGKRVSKVWARILRAADDEVNFQLNSGRRTMGEQLALFRQNMIRVGVPKPGRPLTAVPNPLAPHIRVGRPDHALDVDMFVGEGVRELAEWLRNHGCRVTFPVLGEGWHLEVPARDLLRLYRKLREPKHISDRGMEFLIREEGVRRYAYNDPAGHATFGVGHLIHEGPVTVADAREWGTREKPSSMRRVKRVLRRDLKRFEKVVRRAVKVPLKPFEFDALVSLAFNIGVAGFAHSTVVRELNQGHRRKAADAILLWKKPEILLPRRRREKRLFLTGKYE
jgi:lysozyme